MGGCGGCGVCGLCVVCVVCVVCVCECVCVWCGELMTDVGAHTVDPDPDPDRAGPC